MAEDLAAAARAYHLALDAVGDAERAVVEAKERVSQTRKRLHAAIVAAGRGGTRVRDLARVTGYNRETVRRILRAGGVEPRSDGDD